MMTPTHGPETGCRFCRKGQFFIEHDHLVIRDMLLTLHAEMVLMTRSQIDFECLLRMVPLPQSASYEERYLSLLENLPRIVNAQRPKGFWSAIREQAHRFVS